MEEADGITVITPALRHVAPEHVPKIILAPGADEIPPLTPVERQAVRLSAGIADGERMVVYPGGMNSANQRDILDLYFAIDLLCRRGHSVKLVRTGDEAPQPVSDRFDAVRRERSVDLSRVTRARLIKLLAAADLLIQPGAPGDFDDFRLPSKLPDFFASGRPVILPRANLGLRVRDGEEALLLDRGDANEIAEKAALLLSDPIRAEAIGAAGRRFASTLSWQAGADALMKFYRRLGTL
jgi:glycosyltransferase involved in cell wall biosynthesis